MPLAPNASAPVSTAWSLEHAFYNPCVENGAVPVNASAPLSTAWSLNVRSTTHAWKTAHASRPHASREPYALASSSTSAVAYVMNDVISSTACRASGLTSKLSWNMCIALSHTCTHAGTPAA